MLTAAKDVSHRRMGVGDEELGFWVGKLIGIAE